MPSNLRLIHSGTRPPLTTDRRVARRFRLIRGGLSQAAFADRTGISQRTIRRWESGETAPYVIDLERSAVGDEYALRWAADVLGVTVEELLGLRNEEAA